MRNKTEWRRTLALAARSGERIAAYGETVARLKGGGRWGGYDPWTGENCVGLPEAQCGGIKY